MSLNKWFTQGLTKEAYIERLDKHKDAFQHVFRTFSIKEEDKELFKKTKNLRAIVLASENCGHCMMDIPIFLHIAAEAEIDTRFLIREDNLELMDQYLTNGKRYVPMFIFIDEQGKEVAKWGPWAPEVLEFTNKLKAELPSKDSEGFEEAFQSFVQKVSTTFRSDASVWNYVYEDMKKVLLTL